MDFDYEAYERTRVTYQFQGHQVITSVDGCNAILALEEAQRAALAKLAKAREVLPDILYMLDCVEAHAAKFPAPARIIQRSAKIRVALYEIEEPHNDPHQ